MKKLISITFMILAIVVLWQGCTKPEETGTIYGTVTDYATGEPIKNANVKLKPNGETTLTGMDGTFQFNNLKEGRYSLFMSKNGYVDYDDDYVIYLRGGGNICRDVQMRSQSSSFKLTIDGNEVDTIDFGSNPSVNNITFTIINDGTMALNEVKLQLSSNWVYFQGYNSTSYHSTHLQPNCGFNCVLYIDRSSLSIGENIGYMSVSSGSLTKTFVIKATGLGMPVVTDPIVSDITYYTAVVSSSLTYDGGSPIIDKGFEYSYNDNISCGPGPNNFQTQIPVGHDPNYRRVRAYADNGVHKAYSGWVYY